MLEAYAVLVGHGRLLQKACNSPSMAEVAKVLEPLRKKGFISFVDGAIRAAALESVGEAWPAVCRYRLAANQPRYSGLHLRIVLF